MGFITHTLQLAVHEGLLSQCSIIDSPANARKVVGQCCNSICRIRKSHKKVYIFLFQQNKKKILRNSLDAGTFFLNAAVSRKILVKAKYPIGLGIGIYKILKDSDGVRKNLIGTPLVISVLRLNY